MGYFSGEERLFYRLLLLTAVPIDIPFKCLGYKNINTNVVMR